MFEAKENSLLNLSKTTHFLEVYKKYVGVRLPSVKIWSMSIFRIHGYVNCFCGCLDILGKERGLHLWYHNEISRVGYWFGSRGQCWWILWVTLDCDEDTLLLKIKQVRLIKRVTETLVLDNGMAKGKFIHEEDKALVKDEYAKTAYITLIYIIVVDMILYLSGNACPDVYFAMNCCNQYMFCKKQSHKLALKILGCYLKQTRDSGLVSNPNPDLWKLDQYPDANFYGMYGNEKSTDPACVKNCTGFLIDFADCQVIWVSKV